jgi:glycerol 3-phosphatase-2
VTLLDRYDAVLLDLDGTVYRGGEAVPGAADAVAAAHGKGVAVRFVTNNASRPPREVAAQLNGLGIAAEVAEVSTSAQAATGVLHERLDANAQVLVIGTEALSDEVRNVGLTPVREYNPDVAAVVQGLAQDTGWRELSEAVLAIRAGALWVACNADATLPTERGLVIGNGAMVAAVRTATGQEPLIAGKPELPLMREASANAKAPLAVGDRIDTDIFGAAAAGIDALLVFTGVSTPKELLATDVKQRPRYLAQDIGALVDGGDELAIGKQADWEIGTTIAWRGDGTADPMTLLRALCAAYDHLPDTLDPADDPAAGALRSLGLDRIG